MVFSGRERGVSVKGVASECAVVYEYTRRTSQNTCRNHTATLLVLLPVVSWPWVPAWGSLEPPRRDGENAQKTEKTGGKWARYGLRSVKKGS